ncbi:hypothetical protein RHSIM_Rhsim11G0184400 [Rhododendron simsii]|uniref:Uncharacterized protein n=1 Tax=Rhododendron simsii TaxID=118357 RepID=A0A834G892_RHOSS|nr:hypothetical protein RHSIM_Rhsim11G0184400 [Rhododendron simsii]
MGEEAPPPRIITSCLSNINAFFRVSNPKIFHLFIISGTATFLLGTAMIIEWFHHGQHHPGYRWMVYFAPSIIVFPIIMLIICLVSAQILVKKGEDNKHSSQVVDRSNSGQSSSSETKKAKRLKIQDGLVLFELVDTSTDEEALIVQVGEQGYCMGRYTNLDLIRSLSCQFSTSVGPNKKRKMKRWMSF